MLRHLLCAGLVWIPRRARRLSINLPRECDAARLSEASSFGLLPYLIQNVRFSTRIRNALNAAGMKTIGEIRETSDDNLLSFQDLGPGSIAYLRETLGLPSTHGVRPMGKKPT
jgi:DNA-directed RNA polymerase alpha subunit